VCPLNQRLQFETNDKKKCHIIRMFNPLLFYSMYWFVSKHAKRGMEKSWRKQYGAFFYDHNSIFINKSGLIVVNMKNTFSPDSIESIGNTLPHLKGASFMIMQNEIDCLTGVYQMRWIRYYNKNGKMIYDSEKVDRTKYRLIGFRPIPPDTQIESLAAIVCK